MRRVHKAADANRDRSSGRTSAELRTRARANILVDFAHPRVSNARHDRRERVARARAKETARFLLIARFPGYFPALDLVAALTGTDRQRVSLSASAELWLCFMEQNAARTDERQARLASRAASA